MQEPCQYLTPYQQIEYYNRKSTWRQLYRLKIKWPGMSLWDMYIWLGGGTNHQSGSSSKNTLIVLLLVGVLSSCSGPTEVWLPCDVTDPPSYCSGSTPSGVYMLPVERYAPIIHLTTPTPPQPIE